MSKGVDIKNRKKNFKYKDLNMFTQSYNSLTCKNSNLYKVKEIN